MSTKAHRKPQDDWFEDSGYRTGHNKALTVAAVVSFLQSDLDPAQLTKRVYEFFNQVLSMSAHYDLSSFAGYWLRNDENKERLLSIVRDEIELLVLLDPTS